MKRVFLSICLAAGVNFAFFFVLSLPGSPPKSSVPASSAVVEIIPLPKKEVRSSRPLVLSNPRSSAARVQKPQLVRSGTRSASVARESRARASEPQKYLSAAQLSFRLAPSIQGEQTDPVVVLEPPLEAAPLTAVEQRREWETEEVETLPVKVRHVQPEYPRWALEQGLEGTVSLIFLIDETGKVQNVRITQCSQCAAFDASAIYAVKQWRYKPARKQGPVAVWQPCIVRFRLNQ